MEEQTIIKDKKFQLNITTPRGLKLTETVDMIIMRCIDGDMGILPGHAPVSTVLGDGILRIYNNGIEKKLAVFGGIAEINSTTVNIYTTIAQHPGDIDLERAERDRKEAEAALEEKTEKVQNQSYNLLLRRSLVRIEVSQHMDEDEVDDEDNKYYK